MSLTFRELIGTHWNHPDHRAVGRALLDAVRDAANPWVHPDAGEPWSGVRFAAFAASPQPTHAVDVTASFAAGVASLAAHRRYLDGLGGGDPDAILRGSAEATGARLGVPLAAAFEVIT